MMNEWAAVALLVLALAIGILTPQIVGELFKRWWRKRQ